MGVERSNHAANPPQLMALYSVSGILHHDVLDCFRDHDNIEHHVSHDGVGNHDGLGNHVGLGRHDVLGLVNV